MSTPTLYKFDTASAEAQSFLRSFFDPKYNDITPDDINEAEELQNLVRPLLQEEPQPTVLPLRLPSNCEIYWFGITRTQRELYTQQADLKAFVGTTFAKIRGGRRQSKKDTEFARTLQEFTNGLAYYFQGADGAILREVQRWLQVRRHKPSREIPESRSTRLLLRDFDVAIQTGNRDRAATLLQFIRSRNRLGGLNLVYLQIRLHAAFLEWNEVLDLESISQVCDLQQRPSVVTDDILRAIYQVYLKSDVRKGALEEIKDHLYQVSREYGTVWESRIGLQSDAAWITYGLAAGLLNEDRDAVKAAIESIAETHADRNILLRLLEEKVPESSESSTLQPPSPFEAFENKQLDDALEGARKMEQGPRRTEILLMIASCLQQRSVLKEALTAAESLKSEQKKALNPLARDVLTRIRDRISPTEAQIQGWMDLLRAIRTGSLSHAEVLQTTREDHFSWSLESLIGTPDKLVDILLDIPERQQSTLRVVLSYVVDELLSDANYPDRSLRDVYDVILIYLLETPSPEPETFDHVVDLLPGVLGLLDEEEYQERVDEAASMLDRMSARVEPSRLLDFLDVLVAHPAPDPTARQISFARVNRLRERNPEDWTREQHRFIHKLAHECGLEDFVSTLPEDQETEEETDPLEWLDEKYIGIYTLNESAGRRAEEEIRSRADDVDVRLSHAHKSTDSLVAMAKNSDVMVVVTRHATHAATDAIMSNLGEDTRLVRPGGGGTCSIITDLESISND